MAIGYGIKKATRISDKNLLIAKTIFEGHKKSEVDEADEEESFDANFNFKKIVYLLMRIIIKNISFKISYP